MTFQDEFARRLNAVRGEAAGDGGEDARDKSVRLERSRETGGGKDVSRPWPALSACPSRQSKGSTRTGGGGEHTRHPELVSGPREAKPEGRGVRHEVLSRQAIADKRVQDDEDSSVRGGEVTPPSRLRVSGRSVPRTDLELPGAVPPDTGSGVGLCETESAVLEATDTPTPSPSRKREGEATRHDGWLPDIRVKFLEALAQTGNVQASAYFVQRSRQSAYDLKRRDPDFARAWLAALVLAREEAQDRLQERAIEGIEEPVYYHGEVVGMRRRYDSRLLLAHLARLDRVAEQIPAQRGAARFGEMLEAIGKGEDTAPLIATPTEEELAVNAAEAETCSQPEPRPAEDGEEFYAVRFPDHDGPPDYYRMSPEEAAEWEREAPGLTATPAGTRDEAAINALPCHAEAMLAYRRDEAEKGIYL